MKVFLKKEFVYGHAADADDDVDSKHVSTPEVTLMTYLMGFYVSVEISTINVRIRYLNMQLDNFMR